MRFSTKAITTCAVLAALALALSYLSPFSSAAAAARREARACEHRDGLRALCPRRIERARHPRGALSARLPLCGQRLGAPFSLLGGLAAMLVMIALHALPRLSVYGVSVGGAAAHNCGQVAAAMLTLGSARRSLICRSCCSCRCSPAR